MKILWLSAYSPWPAHHGGKIRLYNLVAQMLARGHTVDLWCACVEPVEWSRPQPAALSLRRFPTKTRSTLGAKISSLLSPLPERPWAMWTPELDAAIRGLSENPPDVVVFEQALWSPLARPLERMHIPFVLDAQNVEWWLMLQIARAQAKRITRTRLGIDAWKYRRLEAALVRSAAAVVAVSEHDAGRLRELGSPAHLAIHPSGVDAAYFNWVDHSELRSATLLMTGTLGYAPNLDACRWMKAEIMPAIRERVPTSTLQLVGGSADLALDLHAPAEGINVVGPVSDVREYMERADVFLVPLRLGSGTRLKVVEALAAGIPVVSTPLGVEGLDLPEDLVIIAKNPAEFSKAVASLVGDPQLRRRLSQAGRRYVERCFSWRDIAAGMEGTLAYVTRSGT